MEYGNLLQQIETFVTGYFVTHANFTLLYHNYDHTVYVVKRVKEIAAHYPLSEHESFVVTAAAWFHDTGHLLGGVKEHELVSAAIMKKFFHDLELPEELITETKQCIMATALPHKPTTFLDQIICDADTFNLGTEEFIKTDHLLKQEFALRGQNTDNWDERTLEFLQQHKYFTSYCKEHLSHRKEKNILIIQNRYVRGKLSDFL